MKQPTLLEMLKAGLHFGHIPSKRHPKMKPFIFGVRSGVHIIDLEQTQHCLDKELNYAKDLTAKGGTILFVATKKQAQELTKEAAEKCGMPYIHEHWIGGLLTNFVEIKKVIKRYNTVKKQFDENSFNDISKKDKVLLDREFGKLTHKVSGISTLTKVPEALFVIDIKKEKTAVTEAAKMGIPVIAVCDSNTNPEKVTHPIPGNDDATKSIAFMTNIMSEAIAEGKVLHEKGEAIAAKKAEEEKKKLDVKAKQEAEKLAKEKEVAKAKADKEVAKAKAEKEAVKVKTEEPKKEEAKK